MPFGLCNTPATFERLMETVLHGLSSETCLVYLDDIIIVGRTFEEHLNNLRKLFQRLQKARNVSSLTSARAWDPWSSCEIQKAQLEDPAIKPILEKKLNSADRPSWQEIAPESPATKRYWALWDSLHLKDGVLYRRWESDDGSSCRWQPILPK
ncbi:hypothetical protein AVEN_70072-1 [Araneus ventricosus]|uniref:Reverse transcriptase domain-containing protein n=1 Tax=Araneus ventricosus TaxID=182803 RepID=A0A4Y2UYS4_ARAVE|nr:hypothetical protein AVEN_70072-1 [Araneus ventricosus]